MLNNFLVRQVLGFTLSIACLACFGGCGSKLNTTEIVGKVSVAGKAIEDGDITFQPLKGSGFTSSSKISKGQYRLSGETGLIEGEYSVKVNAYRESTDKSEMIGGGLDKPPETVGMTRKEQFLPAKYNTNSTIESLVVEKGKAKIEKDFDLK